MTDIVIRPVPAQARSRQRVDDICTAALDVLRRGGIAGWSVAAVAAQAGITAASLYRYFPNADAVLFEVARRQLDETHDRLAIALDGLSSRDEVIEALLFSLHDYEQRFRDDAALRAIWAGTLALDSLIELNVDDSRRNGVLVAERVSPWLARPLDPARAFLVTHLVGAGVVLLLHVSDDEAELLRGSLRALIMSLFDDGDPPAVR